MKRVVSNPEQRHLEGGVQPPSMIWLKETVEKFSFSCVFSGYVCTCALTFGSKSYEVSGKVFWHLQIIILR